MRTKQFYEQVRRQRYRIMGVLLGALGGYLYYYFIGCASGTCPITSNPWISTGYGAVMGVLLAKSTPPSQAEVTEKTIQNN